VTVEVHQASSTDLAAAVVSGELDASFIGLPDRELRGLRLSVIADLEMQFACHRDHPLAARASVDLRTVAGEVFAEVPPSWGVRIANDRAFAAAGLTRTVTYEINDLATVVDFVANGIAVTIMSPVSAVEDARVVFVPIRRHAPRFRVSLATADARPVSPATRRFVEIASEHART
jgi:DNA-binding transcriptional LysR family regulator